MTIKHRITDSENTHVMLDIETLGTGANAIILQIAMVKFGLNDQNGETMKTIVNVFPCIKEQHDEGRTMTFDTVNWWLGPDHVSILANLRKQETSNLVDVRSQIAKHMEEFRKSGVHLWARSPKFDIKILEDFLGTDVPEHSRRHQRDVREYEFISGDRPGASHDAEDDCIQQIILVTNVIQRLFI